MDDNPPFNEEALFEAEIEIRFLLQIMREGLPIDSEAVDAIAERHRRFRQIMDLYVELSLIDLARSRENLTKCDRTLRRFVHKMNLISRLRAHKPGDPSHQARCHREQLVLSDRLYESLIEFYEHERLGEELWDPDAEGWRL
jgi:hypothetical protein